MQMLARVKRDLVKRIEDMEADVKKHHLFTYLIADIRSTMGIVDISTHIIMHSFP